MLQSQAILSFYSGFWGGGRGHGPPGAAFGPPSAMLNLWSSCLVKLRYISRSQPFSLPISQTFFSFSILHRDCACSMGWCIWIRKYHFRIWISCFCYWIICCHSTSHCRYVNGNISVDQINIILCLSLSVSQVKFFYWSLWWCGSKLCITL